MARTIHSSSVSIATLVKSNLGERCLINILMNISSDRKIYKGASSKKKTDLARIIDYGHITNKISKLHAEDISKTEAKLMLKQNNIIV